jgi:hypothetical protein
MLMFRRPNTGNLPNDSTIPPSRMVLILEKKTNATKIMSLLVTHDVP